MAHPYTGRLAIRLRSPLLIVLLLLVGLAMPGNASAQPAGIHYVTFYAHSNGATLILNTERVWLGQKTVDVTSDIEFKLEPVLGGTLQIYGGITMTIYLRASSTLSGIVTSSLSEVRSDGTEIPIPGATISSPIVLTTQVNPVTLGVGIINYTLVRGNSISLHIQVQHQSTVIPQLVWDDPSTPTNLRLPTVSPTEAHFEFSSPSQVGRILQIMDTADRSRITIRADVTDVFGVYRLTGVSLQLTAPNGTISVARLGLLNSSTYVRQYSVSMNLMSGKWQISLSSQDDSGNQYSFEDYLWATRFYPVTISVADSAGSPIQNVSLQANLGNQASWMETTNSTGSAVFSLPDSAVVGPMDLTMKWLGAQRISSLVIVGPSVFRFNLNIYNLELRVLMDGLVPLPYATVKLMQGNLEVAQVTTQTNGLASLTRVLQGNYTLQITYPLNSFQEPISINSDQTLYVSVPTPHRTITMVAVVALVGASTYLWARRKRMKLYPHDFSFFYRLVRGTLPKACFMVIVGNSGSGKSALLNTLVAEHLARGPSIFITSTEYPDAIRENMSRLGVLGAADADAQKIVFIDAYSAVGGTASREKHHVTSHTDLTALGLEVSKALESAGPAADVYLDSLTPLMTALRIDYLLNFMHALSAKVKANGGKLCLTIGSAVENGDLTKLEETADCVIEVQLQESGKGQRRRLRVKKLRDHPYDDKWTRFQVQSGLGIIFLTREKPEPP